MRTEHPLPKNFLRSCLLLLLREQPAHGYDLLERLRPFSFDGHDPGGLYRALRALENDGLVRSAWKPSHVGPDRRIYELTRAGMEELHRRAKELRRAEQTLGIFLGRYGEFVALEPLGAARTYASERK
jgi:PadR family transcriptional regulator, regulatory protein PadR